MAAPSGSVMDQALHHLGAFTDKHATTASVKAAEAGLEQLASYPGFTDVVLRLIEPQDPPVPRALRQLGTSLLKRTVVGKHWHPLRSVDDGVEPPAGGVPGTSSFEVPEEEKAAVRARLPAVLSDPDGQIRSSVAVALGAVANEDWPTYWPEFIDGVLACLSAVTSAEAAAAAGGDRAAAWLRADGALQCLETFIGKISTRHMPLLAAALHPQLLALATLDDAAGADAAEASALRHSSFGLAIRASALGVLRKSIDTLESCTHHDEKAIRNGVKQIMARDIMGLLQAISTALQTPGWGARLCALKLAAMRLASGLVMQFPVKVKEVFPAMAGAVAAFAQEAFSVFCKREVDTPVDDHDAKAAHEVDGVTPSPLDGFASAVAEAYGSESLPSDVCLQLLTFMQACLMCDRVPSIRKTLASGHGTLAYMLLAACQLSEQTLAIWGDEPDAFIAEEIEDGTGGGYKGVNLRQEAKSTAHDLIDAVGPDAARSVLNAAWEALTGALPATVNGTLVSATHRWKAVEAGLFLVGACDKYLVKPERLLPHKQRAKYARESHAILHAAETGRAAPGRTVALPELPITASTFIGQLIALIHAPDSAFAATDAADVRAAAMPYLLGRCLSLAAQVADARGVSADDTTRLMGVSLEGLTPEQSLPVRLAACKTLAKLVKKVDAATVLEPVAPTIIERLMGLLEMALAQASAAAAAATSGAENAETSMLEAESTAVVLVRLLVRILMYAPVAAAAAEAQLTPTICHLWLRKGWHPLLAPGLSAGLESLVTQQSSEAAGHAMGTVMPVVVSVLQATTLIAEASLSAAATGSGSAAAAATASTLTVTAPDGSTIACALTQRTATSSASAAATVTTVDPLLLVETACRLVTMTMRRYREILAALPTGTEPGTPAATTPQYVTFPPQILEPLAWITRLVPVHADRKVLIAAGEALMVALRLSGPQLFTAAAAPAAAGAPAVSLQPEAVMAAAAHLISDDALEVTDEVSSQAAPLITALISHSGAAGLVPAVLPAISQRLGTAALPSFVGRLLVAIGHCIISDPDAAIPVLASTLVRLPVKGGLAAHSDASTAEEAVVIQTAVASAAPADRPTQSALVLFMRGIARYFPLVQENPLTRQVLLVSAARLLLREDVLEATAGISTSSDKETGGAGSTFTSFTEAAGISSRTRSKRTKSGKKIAYSPVSLPVKLLTMVVKEWAVGAAEDGEASADTGDDDDDVSHDEDEEEEGLEAEEEGEEGADAAGGAASGGRRRKRSPFVPADSVADLLTADDSDDDGGGLDKDDVMLADLFMGGDPTGTGKTLESMLRYLNATGMGGDDDEDGSEDGSEEEGGRYGGGAGGGILGGQYDDEEVDAIAVWDEVGEPREEGVLYSPVPRDPVISTFTQAGGAERLGLVQVKPATGVLSEFLSALAAAAASAPTGTVAALAGATAAELSEEERALLTAHVAGGAAGAAGGSR